MAQLSATFRRDSKVIALVCVPHMLSHAYFLVMPPLFPLLKAAFGVSYTELGFALSVFGLAAGLGQIPVGFLVDRIGGRVLLIAGMALQGTAIALIGVSGPFWQLVVLCGLAGAAHTVYHPADYAILTATVEPGRLGRAYGIHSFTGTLGFAIARCSWSRWRKPGTGGPRSWRSARWAWRSRCCCSSTAACSTRTVSPRRHASSRAAMGPAAPARASGCYCPRR